VDFFTVASCKVQKVGAEISIKGLSVLYLTCNVHSSRFPASECVSDHGKATCKGIGGECVTERDGYYLVTGLCMAFGLIFFLAVIIPRANKLQGGEIY
jgi:PAT family acetyl-CoA transporter-like MFS transporter 1